jgi:hypothetical protein
MVQNEVAFKIGKLAYEQYATVIQAYINMSNIREEILLFPLLFKYSALAV